MRAGRNIQGANSLGWSTSPCACSCCLSCRLCRCEGRQLGPPTARVCSSGRRDWVQAAEASNGDLELERRGKHTCKALRSRQGRCCGQAGCWTDGDASEAARRMSGLTGWRSSGGYPSIRNSVPMRAVTGCRIGIAVSLTQAQIARLLSDKVEHMCRSHCFFRLLQTEQISHV